MDAFHNACRAGDVEHHKMHGNGVLWLTAGLFGQQWANSGFRVSWLGNRCMETSRRGTRVALVETAIFLCPFLKG